MRGGGWHRCQRSSASSEDAFKPVKLATGRVGVQSEQVENSELDEVDQVDDAALARVMRSVPLGTAVLAGSAVALLVLGYLLIYLLIFIPRGSVG